MTGRRLRRPPATPALLRPPSFTASTTIAHRLVIRASSIASDDEMTGTSPSSHRLAPLLHFARASHARPARRHANRAHDNRAPRVRR
ncbi:hypothetical protein WS55_15735 [Burkholderia pseudomultivorans]|nr:hypothetical protein WS57_21965 [Burkholderia pseudomultivorans]KVC25783.1 hypothetical protein WS55_15735 [Burkholderia pseudomultivorans]KVC39678.1 hypothetical protein WS56_02435 [Burkholderia pseudomultivorans]